MNELILQTDTAKQSYHSEQPLVRTINDKVLAWIRVNGEVSRNDIQRALGLTSRQAGCAVWHLIKQSKIKTCGEKQDSVSKHTVQTLCINEQPEIKFTKKSNTEKLKEIREICVNRFGEAFIENDILEIINS